MQDVFSRSRNYVKKKTQNYHNTEIWLRKSQIWTIIVWILARMKKEKGKSIPLLYSSKIHKF